MNNIYIRGVEFPSSVKGVTVEDENGDFNVYINVNLCEDARKTACKHELKHISLMHFQDFNPVVVNELEASS